MNSIVKNTKVVTTSTTTVELSAEEKVALEALITARQAIKALQEQEELAKEILKSALANAEAGTIDGKIAVKISNQPRKGTDNKKLEAEFPEAYEATLTVTAYQVVKTL